MKDNLKLLRVAFPDHHISKLPKPTKSQTDTVKADFKAGIRCTICGGWHHKDVIHLDYVGHAALTDRLLDVDPEWNWEPLAVGADGYPVIDRDGGMWIRLTVCGVSRLGYGDAQGKNGGDAMKERIGDALRNAAMRFGAALDLWHKGDLHLPETEPQESAKAVEVELVNTTDISAIRTALIARGSDEVKFCEHYKVASIEFIPKEWVVGILAALNKKQKPVASVPQVMQPSEIPNFIQEND